MVAKTGALTFDVNAQSKRAINAAIQFSTQDINTARLSFMITKDGAPLPLSAVEGKLAMTTADGSRFIRTVTLVNKTEGLAEYVLTEDEIRHYGAVKAELLLRYTNGQSLSIHKFGFEIDRSLIDQDIAPIAEYYIDDFEALKGRVDELYDSVVDTVRELEAKFADLENVETKTGAQAKVDAHANKSDMHVTAQKKTEWDAKETPTGAQAKVDAHANDAVLHVTKAERSAWNAKETTTGAQEKVDSHASNEELHTTAAEKNKWNTSQIWRITDDNGQVRVYINNSNDYHEVLPRYKGFTHFASDTSAINGPGVALRGFWVCNATGSYGSVVGFDNINRTWRKTVANGEWGSWERLLTSSDLSSTWNQVTLVAGTVKQFAGNPLQFSIRQNALHLRGSFEGIPANDTVIARFTQKPSGSTIFGGQTIGAYGSARFTLGVDGSLKFDGMDSADNSKVTRIEINEYIPLW